MERIKMSCPCGTTQEAESGNSMVIAMRQGDFLKAHAICLEAQQSAETPQSETPSPVVTSTLEETSDTSIISYSWSSPASQAGTLPRSVQQAIAALFNLPLHRGQEPVEVTLSIRIPRAATPPSGSASSLPAEERWNRSGHVGEWSTTSAFNPGRAGGESKRTQTEVIE